MERPCRYALSVAVGRHRRARDFGANKSQTWYTGRGFAPNAMSEVDSKADENPVADKTPRSSKAMTRLVLDLVRPYRGWLVIVFVAMVFETATTLAAPWPLK